MGGFWDALFLQSGYNATLVSIGAALLGFSAGATGTFLLLRKRSLVSDALAHATLPGLAFAFIILVLLGGDGRWLPGLMLGAALTALIGLLAIEWIVARSRLGEDAAIGAVLSVFFGFGVVLLTLIQNLDRGRQAGLQDFLLGSTAGMLRTDAISIAVASAVTLGLIWLLRRQMILVTFDQVFAASRGVNVRRTDLAIMGLGMLVTVIGLKVVGLVLIVALLIIPPVTARFWSERVETVTLIAGVIGALSGWVGTAISASAPALPTGPIIVLVATALFVLSLLLAPARGVLASLIARRRYQIRVHRRQGLLAIAHGETIHDGLTLRILRAEGLLRADAVATDAGMSAAFKVARDEERWSVASRSHQGSPVMQRRDGLTPIEEVFTPDEIAHFDREIFGPRSAE